MYRDSICLVKSNEDQTLGRIDIINQALKYFALRARCFFCALSLRGMKNRDLLTKVIHSSW